MERGDGEPATDHARPEQVDDALPHLRGGLVGERERQDLPRRDPAGDQVGHPPGDDAGLARTGTGEDEQGALGVLDGLGLGLGEPGEDVVHVQPAGRVRLDGREVVEGVVGGWALRLNVGFGVGGCVQGVRRRWQEA